jgi:hypothetical protein
MGDSLPTQGVRQRFFKDQRDSGSLLHIMKTFSTFLSAFLQFRYKNEALRFYRHEDGNDEVFLIEPV